MCVGGAGAAIKYGWTGDAAWGLGKIPEILWVCGEVAGRGVGGETGGNVAGKIGGADWEEQWGW